MATFSGQQPSSMEGTEGLQELFPQVQARPAWSSPDAAPHQPALEFFSQGASSDGAYHQQQTGQHDNDINLYLDLNSQAPEYLTNTFPHIDAYQELLKSRRHGRGATTWRPPRQSGSGGRGGRGGRVVAPKVGRGAASNAGRGATPNAGRGAPPNAGRGAAPNTGRGAAPNTGRGRGAAPSVGRGRGTAPSVVHPSASSSPATSGTQSDAADGMDDEDDIMGNDAMIEGFDKAIWSAENTTLFCDLCVDEIRAGNTSNGHMTGRGYKNICYKYFGATQLRHTDKQMKNRWGQLKGLYGFWMFLNSHTGLGRHKGTVAAEEKFWKDHTHKKPLEWKNLRHRPPDNLDQLEEMFHNLVVDGSSSSIPGEYMGAEGDGEDADGEDGHGGAEGDADGSPMSASNKRPGATSSTATSPSKKTKSPMVKIMWGMLDNMKNDSESTQKVISGEVMADSMKRALQLVVESGAPQSSLEYFMATQLFVKAKNWEVCFNFEKPEDRFLWLKRWCQVKKLY